MMFRRRYLDLRLGWSTFAPVIAFANFIMISYIALKDVFPIEVVLPFVVFGMIIGLTLLGNIFRKKQLSIDNNLNYEQQTEPAKTARILFDDLHKIQKHMGIEISQESINRCRYMYDIERGKFGK